MNSEISTPTKISMTPQQIVGLFVRILAVWMAASALELVALGASIASERSLVSSDVPYGIAAFLFIGAICLWFFPMFVAHKFVPRTHYENTLTLAARETAVVAIVVLGLWLFVARALPSVTQYLITTAVILANHESPSVIGSGYKVRMVEGLIELVLAAVLTFKAEVVASYFIAERRSDKDK